MELMEIIQIAKVSGIGVGVFLLTLIKIPKIQINLWGWLARKFGKAVNGEVMQAMSELRAEVKAVDNKLEQRIKISEEYKVSERRRAILIFDDEIYRKLLHSQESFNDILEQIDGYETYCNEHPEYPNNKAIAAIDHIKKTYQECLEKRTFLH